MTLFNIFSYMYQPYQSIQAFPLFERNTAMQISQNYGSYPPLFQGFATPANYYVMPQISFLPAENFMPQINYDAGSLFNFKFNVPQLSFAQNTGNIFNANNKFTLNQKKKTITNDYAQEFADKVSTRNTANLAEKYGKANADKIKDLSSEMQIKTRLLLDFAKSKGLNVTITSGFRTQAQQADLRRRKPNLAAKNSLHCQGKAIDINISSGKDSDYKLLADYAKSIGMRWGGDFKKVKERWHFDLGWA